jgi:hypothetical protein
MTGAKSYPDARADAATGRLATRWVADSTPRLRLWTQGRLFFWRPVRQGEA